MALTKQTGLDQRDDSKTTTLAQLNALVDALTSFTEALTILSLKLGSASGPTVSAGTNTPEGAVTAPVGSVFLRTNGGANTTLYIKESGAGNTGWIAK